MGRGKCVWRVHEPLAMWLSNSEDENLTPANMINEKERQDTTNRGGGTVKTVCRGVEPPGSAAGFRNVGPTDGSLSPQQSNLSFPPGSHLQIRPLRLNVALIFHVADFSELP